MSFCLRSHHQHLRRLWTLRAEMFPTTFAISACADHELLLQVEL
jgi:hypothetical protein